MKIEKFSPSSALMPFIKEFLIIETDLETESKTIPDTSMVMAFRYMGNVQKMEGETKQAIPATAISGIINTARRFYYSKETANLLVIFREGGFNFFSTLPAHEFFCMQIESKNIFLQTELNEVSERLAEARSNEDRINIIQNFLLRRLNNKKPDELINNAIQIIKHRSGIIRIKDLASSLHISQDPFEKRFRALIGSTPKQYSSIIRLRHLIKKCSSLSSLTEASYEAGYFDQSHFIKNFRQFTGQAPKDFFKSPSFW